METLIICQKHIDAVFSVSDYVFAVEQAFQYYGNGDVQMPPKVYLTFESGDVRCMPVAIPSLGVAGVKNVTVYPNNASLPTVLGTITLLDSETGAPLAIMDGTRITNMRTGAAGGVAARYLAREDARSAAFIGAGAQAQTQLNALLITRPDISRIFACDINQKNIQNFIQNAKPGLEVLPTATVQEAVCDADIVTTVTPVRSPVVMQGDLRPGTHINAIGADAQGKQELDPALLSQAKIVVDNWEQASHSGEINVPLSQGLLSQDDIYADIGEVVTGSKPGRENDEEITVFDSTGLGIQDIVAAKMIYDRITADTSLRKSLTSVDFL